MDQQAKVVSIIWNHLEIKSNKQNQSKTLTYFQNNDKNGRLHWANIEIICLIITDLKEFAQLKLIGDRQYLFHDGHRFYRKWGVGSTTYWQCAMYSRNKCGAKVTTKMIDGYEMTLKVPKIMHTHDKNLLWTLNFWFDPQIPFDMRIKLQIYRQTFQTFHFVLHIERKRFLLNYYFISWLFPTFCSISAISGNWKRGKFDSRWPSLFKEWRNGVGKSRSIWK